MQLLELLYQREFKNVKVLPRKVSLDAERLILYGPSGSGKSFLLYELLSTLEYGSYLYIDFNDFRVEGITKESLEEFIDQKSITTLVLDNFDFSFEPMFVPTTIITTNLDKKIDGFTIKDMYPLDFEEFLTFDKRFINERVSFNHFTVMGTFPLVASAGKDSFMKRFELLLKSMFQDPLEFEIVRSASLKQATVVTLLGLFKDIKLNYRVSKDKFYRLIKRLQEKRVLFLIDQYEKNSPSKKLYMIDFALRGAISFDKDFIKRFDNIIFLELLKRGEKVYYHSRVDFILPQKLMGVIPMAFIPKLLLENRIKLLVPIVKRLEFKKLQIVTLELEFCKIVDGIEVEVLPFWNFALGN
jgi:predicted AAA+ superfamily ATPase